MTTRIHLILLSFCFFAGLAVAHKKRSIFQYDPIEVAKANGLPPPTPPPAPETPDSNVVSNVMKGHSGLIYTPDPHLHPIPDFHYANPSKRRIAETEVECLKTHMLVTINFNVPFHGYIYPHNHFAKCLLFAGQNSWKAEILLKHGTCGDQENTIVYHGKTFTDPIIEHRLVIQWDREIIGEDDSSVIVRCDRPDDYNKTVEWNLNLRDMTSTVESNTHPGPRMWMEIQRGEGPRAPPLNDESVYVGDVLTLIFTLSDNVYWFDSNILTCYAVDGSEQKTSMEWDSVGHTISAAARVFSGETTVIENGCSVKPKLFSHFQKEKDNKGGEMVTLHYAHFKAFRFPTSMKIVIQCDVQVCYKSCLELPPCSEAFTPRAAEAEHRRRRRAAEGEDEADSFDMERVNFFRSLEVFMPDESDMEAGLKLTSPTLALPEFDDCYNSSTFFGSVLSLVFIVIVLVLLLFYMFLKQQSGPTSFFTPNKPM